MEDFKVTPDYVKGQFHVWQDNQLIDIKLPAEVQAAVIKQIVADCCQAIRNVLASQLSDTPTGLESLMIHSSDEKEDE